MNSWTLIDSLQCSWIKRHLKLQSQEGVSVLALPWCAAVLLGCRVSDESGMFWKFRTVTAFKFMKKKMQGHSAGWLRKKHCNNLCVCIQFVFVCNSLRVFYHFSTTSTRSSQSGVLSHHWLKSSSGPRLPLFPPSSQFHVLQIRPMT